MGRANGLIYTTGRNCLYGAILPKPGVRYRRQRHTARHGGRSMKKYRVYGLMTASVLLGEYEAEDSEAAIKLAEEDDNANWMPTICHQCSREVELNEIYETDAVEV